MKKLVYPGFIFLILSVSACLSAPGADQASSSRAELRHTLWKLTELDGKAVETREGRRMASLTLASEESRARIVTACNQGTAGFTIEGNSLKFGIAAATKMMCPADQMQDEAAFFKVIGKTVRYEIKGETLLLYDIDSRLLASFHSEYLK